ncbi:hypothetical protein JJB09_05165 [Rhizobium sp. KVB221]|uniref:t-SNARE coiled-coil homology domain-containing protein n=1 Tax=Rhizobium setariae TaxID=2801340 RepID=A0A936YNA0_9HYPH|nr:hypothetical protein [Rhizobium setariae]MBL0371411.1 hypothetical protein [Rhizobium setariae]
MAAVDGDLIHEMLKRIQSDISAVKFDISGLKTEMINIRGTMVSIQMDIHNIYNRLDRSDQRLDHIENRLELRELSERGQAPLDPSSCGMTLPLARLASTREGVHISC